jgi:hypothetical protein
MENVYHSSAIAVRMRIKCTMCEVLRETERARSAS